MPQVKIKQGSKSAVNNNAGVLNAGTLAITTDTNELFVTHNDGTVHQLCNPVIGGRNLLLNSKVPQTGTAYNIGNWTSSRYFIIGETLTLTIKGNIPGTKLFGLWFLNCGRRFCQHLQKRLAHHK